MAGSVDEYLDDDLSDDLRSNGRRKIVYFDHEGEE